MTSQDSKFSKAAIHGTAWRYFALFSGKAMVFISTVILARLLTKDDFGLVGYAVTIVAFLEELSDLGVTAAVIYYPEDQKRTSTGFWLNQFSGVFFFVMAWFLAPAMAVYFRDPRVVDVTRVLALTFPFLAFGYMQDAVLLKRLSFGRTFVPSFVKAILKGVTSIGFAYAGFGPWSLIWGQLTGTLFSSIVYWFMSPWRPSFTFDFGLARALLKYGVVLLFGDLLAMFLMNLDYLLVGRYLGSVQLGVYSLAFRMPDLMILELARALSVVLFPIYTSMREQTDSLKRGFYLATRYVSLLTIPMGLGLALVAEPFVLTFFTDKWADAIPVVRGIAIYAMLLSVVHNTGSVYWAEGRPQILTWVGLTRLVVLFPALFWAATAARSIVWVSWMHAAVALFSALLNFIIATRLIGLPILDIGKALRPGLIGGTLMGAVVFLTMNATRSVLEPWQLLTVNVLVGGVVYVASLWFLQRDVVVSATRQVLSAVGRGAD